MVLKRDKTLGFIRSHSVSKKNESAVVCKNVSFLLTGHYN